MALGRHWEWRGFGTVSPQLRKRWSSFPKTLPDQDWLDVVDRYLWVPGYGMNAKMRSGPPIGDCLKFKRLRARWKQLELWHEDPQDIHKFPLRRSDLKWLATELHITLPDKQPETVGFETALEIFRQATPTVNVIEVHKHRQARCWTSGDTSVIVEVAEISAPEPISSLSLESTIELTEWSTPDQMSAARDSVQMAYESLGIDTEDLRAMNYLEALTTWADDNRLKDLL